MTSLRPSRRIPLPALVLAIALLAAVFCAPALGHRGSSLRVGPNDQGFSAARITDDQKRVCVYDRDRVDGLARFAALTGRDTIDCAMVYTGSPDWAGWVDPYFLHEGNANLNWASWVSDSPANDRRQLIISQPLIPTDLAGSDWVDAGANGKYTGYARQFAQNLVAAGVGDAVIRLSWEMNGDWNIDSIPDTPGGDAKWIRFWRLTVLAMRSVPGAHFTFDWCPNNGYRDISLEDYYPGDDVVDIIGDDAYDSGVPLDEHSRWRFIFDRPDGLHSIVSFARAHHKPLSIPEWGVGPRHTQYLAGGDDAEYVRHMAKIVAENDFAFQTYFYNYGWATQLHAGSQSLSAYHAAFGDGGYAAGPNGGTDILRSSPLSRRPRAAHRG